MLERCKPINSFEESTVSTYQKQRTQTHLFSSFYDRNKCDKIELYYIIMRFTCIELVLQNYNNLCSAQHLWKLFYQVNILHWCTVCFFLILTSITRTRWTSFREEQVSAGDESDFCTFEKPLEIIECSIVNFYTANFFHLTIPFWSVRLMFSFLECPLNSPSTVRWYCRKV